MSQGRNFPTFAELAAMTLDQVASLEIDTIEALDGELTERSVQLAHDKAILNKVKSDLLEPTASALFQGEGRDTGTVTIARNGRAVSAVRKKVVTWSQEFLAGMWAKIKAAGDDPAVYIKREESVSYKVNETAFKDWPPAIQAAFTPGRTVKPSATEFTIKPRK